MDIAIFYIDPNKHSAKLTQATARDLNLIAADNFDVLPPRQAWQLLYILLVVVLTKKRWSV